MVLLVIVFIIVISTIIISIADLIFTRIHSAIGRRNELESLSFGILEQVINGESNNVNGLPPAIRLELMRLYLLEIGQVESAKEVEKAQKHILKPWYLRHIWLIVSVLLSFIMSSCVVICITEDILTITIYVSLFILVFINMFFESNMEHIDNYLYEHYQSWTPKLRNGEQIAPKKEQCCTPTDLLPERIRRLGY